MLTHAQALIPLAAIPEFDAALDRSKTRPILIFKHSLTCGTSAYAFEEIQALLAQPSLAVDVYLVDVRAHRAVSNAIAARLHVRHESPQVLLIADGTVRWQATHFRVTADAIAAAIASSPHS